ncbi:MAG TPA: TolC family protein [Vicinamibacterales bacterium]|nr:TolC family protein [Vicinamibacterales bacterium]
MRLLIVVWLVVQPFRAASAQPPTPSKRLSFADAVQQAVERNPTVRAAASAILRAEGQIRIARAATLLQVSGSATTTTLNTGVEFQGTTVTPQNSVQALITADMPVVAAAAWARRAQAEDQRQVAELTVADTKRQIAAATADAYLTIVALRRVVDADVRARDVAKAHFDLATELEQRGSGSRLNALRAQQQYSSIQTQLESSRIAVYRAQEALGVLVGDNEPVDAGDEPAFDVPPDDARLELFRTDLKLFAAEQSAAERVVRDSRRDWWPTVDAVFVPQTTYPSPFFVPANSWQFQLRANVPMVDSGSRAGTRMQREAAAAQARETLAGATLQAGSQVRAARVAIASAERGLGSARAAAEQAEQVVTITNISFRAGAATNIEVIDAQRAALDAETQAAVAQDVLTRARFELLNALGRFP